MVAFLRVLFWVCFCVVHASALTDLSRRSYLNTSRSSTTLHIRVSPSSSHTSLTVIDKPNIGTWESPGSDPRSSGFSSSEDVDRTGESPPGTLSKPAINTADATTSFQPSATAPSLPEPPNSLVGEGQTDARLRSSEFESKQGASLTPAQPSSLRSTSRRYLNGTISTRTSSSSRSLITSVCSSRRPDEPYTLWIVLPNPTTITVLEGKDYPLTSFSSISEFTPPVYCPEPSTDFPTIPHSSKVFSGPLIISSLTEQPIPTLGTPFFGTPNLETSNLGTGKIITFITTSKNPVVLRTTPAPPVFPVPGVRTTSKKTVNPATVTPLPPSNADMQSLQSSPVETGQPVANSLQPGNVVIVDGAVFSAIGSSVVVFESETLSYGGTSTLTTTFHNEAITIGTAITFDHTTLGGPENSGTQLGIAGGISVTEIGQSVGVIGSTSLTVGPGVFPTTIIVDEYTITANSGGLELAGITLSYPFNPSSETSSASELTVHKLVSTIVVVAGSTYTLGIGGVSSSTTFTPYLSTSELRDGGFSTGFSTPLATETAAKTSKKSTATFSEPMYGLLGVCFMICIGALE